jgi:hypothetical protein
MARRKRSGSPRIGVSSAVARAGYRQKGKLLVKNTGSGPLK